MIEITSKPLSPQFTIDKVKKDDYGAIVTFVGTVRNTTRGRKVAFLKIETRDEKAEAKLHEVVSDINQKWQLHDVVISRRIGKLRVGEIALIIAVAAAHRQEAFQACQYAVDRLKQGEITTEKEVYETGESPAEDRT
jgi:molybdopterin synthase catalytic subunit